MVIAMQKGCYKRNHLQNLGILKVVMSIKYINIGFCLRRGFLKKEKDCLHNFLSMAFNLF